MDPLRTLKIVLIGDSGVGKTCIRSQFIHHVFSNGYRATIGGDYLTKTINSNQHDESVVLQIWDTAGQERFNSISKTFYRGADVVILVFDVTNFESFTNLKTWISRFLENCLVSNPGIIIVGNKSDRFESRKISLRQAKEFAGSLDLNIDLNKDVLETSANNHIEVEKLFNRAADLGLSRLDDNHQILSFDNIDITDTNKTSSRCC